MSNQDQRRQWADHMKDEAEALKRQQVTAGDTHSPVEGPLPHSSNDLQAAVAAAVAAENERCARLAEGWTAGDPDTARAIGAAIRAVGPSA